MQEMLERILDKLDKIDEKIDGHTERIAKVEEKSSANAGWIKVLLTGIITLAVGLVTTVVSRLFKTF
jgi:hypothetical protein